MEKKLLSKSDATETHTLRFGVISIVYKFCNSWLRQIKENRNQIWDVQTYTGTEGLWLNFMPPSARKEWLGRCRWTFLTLLRMSPGLPEFKLQTADDESRFTGIRIPLLYFPLKTVQTQVIFLC